MCAAGEPFTAQALIANLPTYSHVHIAENYRFPATCSSVRLSSNQEDVLCPDNYTIECRMCPQQVAMHRFIALLKSMHACL